MSEVAIIAEPVVVLTFNATNLAGAIANTKNRATQIIEIGRARVVDGLSPAAVAEAVNPHYSKLTDGEVVSASKFGDGAVKNLVATYKFLQEFDIIEGNVRNAALDRLIVKAINVIEKGQSAAVEAARADIADLDRDDEGFLGGVMTALIKANALALELRKVKPEIAPKDEDEESTDEPAEVAKRSLVDVILANVAALDIAGITDDEAERLLTMAETLMGRIINRPAPVADAA